MSVTINQRTIILGAASDEVTGKYLIQGVQLDHTAGANAVLTDSSDRVIANLRTTTSVLADRVMFPECMLVKGLKAGTLSAGTLTVFLAP